jgi:hypothetical protein
MENPLQTTKNPFKEELMSRFYVSAHTSRFGGTVFFVFDREVEDPETGLDAWVGYAENRADAEERARELHAAAAWTAGEVR